MNILHIPTDRNGQTFLGACSTSCRKLIAKLQSARQSLFDEFRPRIPVSDHLLRLALNEAEAMALETGFPALVFPTLAREKVEALAAWNRKQQALRAPAFELAS